MRNGLIEWPNGDKAWYLNDKLHRTDGPAIEYPDGTKEWFLNGKRHRVDGPAIEHSDGTKAWYLNGKPVKEEELFQFEIDKMFDEIKL